MIELDGVEYSVATPEENVTSMVDYINNYCAVNNIRNSKGELIYIEQNTTSPIYMIMYGLAYLVSAVQRLVYNVGCTFSITSSSERQLLNLATLANVKRKKATRTTISCLIYASSSTDENPSPCIITTSLSKTIPVSGTNIVFHPAYDIEIPVGGARKVILIAEQEGSYEIAAGVITSFDTNVGGLRNIVSEASIPGKNQETIADLRLRLQNRGGIQTQEDRAMEAIEELDGVSLCNIYFNRSTTSNALVGNITVPPRQALLLVQGYNEDIAKTFYAHMSCETTNPLDITRLIGGTPQYYYTHAGQAIPVYIVSPQQQEVYVQVYIKGEASASLQATIKDTVCALMNSLYIGKSLTSADVISIIKNEHPTIDVQGVYVSKDGSNYSFQVTPLSDTLFILTDENITVEGSV